MLTTVSPNADKSTHHANHGLPSSFETVSCIVHLAVFGILGVVTRFLLQKLFGPGVFGMTRDLSVWYLDLPSNLVGSFLMGWFGVVFKGDISNVSEHLAVGLTTGYLGSLTTFRSWNQKMLELSTKGKWLCSVSGYVIGLTLALLSIFFGILSAKVFRWLLNKRQPTSLRTNKTSYGSSFTQRWIVMAIMMLILGFLWGLSVALEKREFANGGGRAQLWLACIFGPVGVWIRWILARRLNGRGLGRSAMLKWFPFGTLVANVGAACLMAALSTVKNVVHTKTTETVATGIQLGFLGCLSTVSTFINELYEMLRKRDYWRALAYATITIIVSFVLGTLIYSVPVWTKGYN